MQVVSRLPTAVRHFAFLAVGSSALGVLFAYPALMAGDDAQPALLRSLADWWSWGVVTPLIVHVDRVLPFSSRELGKKLLAHLGVSIPVVLVYLALNTTLLASLGHLPWAALEPADLLKRAWEGRFLWVWPIYWLIAGGALGVRYYQQYLAGELRVERLERLTTEARLQSLRLQLDPHFLFNALNTVSAQTETQPKLARQMLGHLGDLLRASLDSRDRPEIPLREELAQLEHYLAIQRIRFGDRLCIPMDVGADVAGAQVPALILQPLVENAIRHGISPKATGGRVGVSARRVGDELVLRVTDDGVGMQHAIRSGEGMGLENCRQRLAGLYGAASSFAIRSPAEGGTEVELRIPWNVMR
jgi:two-component system, LytTR family, sensor kinase